MISFLILLLLFYSQTIAQPHRINGKEMVNIVKSKYTKSRNNNNTINNEMNIIHAFNHWHTMCVLTYCSTYIVSAMRKTDEKKKYKNRINKSLSWKYFNHSSETYACNSAMDVFVYVCIEKIDRWEDEIPNGIMREFICAVLYMESVRPYHLISE